MIRVARDFKPLVDNLSAAVARPQTARRLVLFFSAAVLVVGDRTVSAVLRLLSLIEPVNPSTFRYGHKWIVLAVLVELPYAVVIGWARSR